MTGTLEILAKDKNLFLYKDLNLISIFDHIRYDRSDYDILSPAQRNYLIDKLKSLDFSQSTGRIMTSNTIRFIFPKPQILSNSPGDIMRSEKASCNDYHVLTPTQMAFFIVSKRETEIDCLKLLKKLVNKQPINMKKLDDYFTCSNERSFWSCYHQELKETQEDLVKTSQLAHKKHLGSLV